MNVFIFLSCLFSSHIHEKIEINFIIDLIYSLMSERRGKVREHIQPAGPNALGLG